MFWAAKKDDSFTENDKIIVVLGACGSGKTQFINTAIGEKLLGVGDDLKIKTRDIQHARRHLPGLGDVIFVDTPALPAPDSHSMTPEDIEKSLGKWLETAGKVMYGPKSTRRAHVSGVIYLHRISDNKLTDRVFLHRGMLRTLCGERYAKRTLLVTTMWETLAAGDKDAQAVSPGGGSRAKKEKRETEIKKRYWDLMESEGAPPMHRHDGSNQSALEAVQVLLERDVVDQPIIFLLGQRGEDQVEFIRDLAIASDVEIKPDLLSDLSASNSSTFSQNFPLTKRSAKDPQSLESVNSDGTVSIMVLPSIDSPQFAGEVKRLQRLHGRDVIAFLYLTSTGAAATDGVSTELDISSPPEALVEAMSLNRSILVVASRTERSEANPTESSTDEVASRDREMDFTQRWIEWNRKYSAEGVRSSFPSAPILEYGTGLHGAIEVVSTIWRLNDVTNTTTM